MWILETVVVAFSMFSAIPMPRIDWNEKNMRYALCAFPLVGLVIGALIWAWTVLAAYLIVPQILRGAVLCLIPVWVTGGIHLDGYGDTSDALASHQSREKMLEILKDPHVGSFAVIRLMGYFVLTFALWTGLSEVPAAAAAMGFCLSRCLSGLAVAAFPMAKNTGLAHTFQNSADKKPVAVLLGLAAGALVIGMILQGLCGVLAAALMLLVFLWYRIMSVRRFGGITGDLAGWFLQNAELAMLVGLMAASCLEGL